MKLAKNILFVIVLLAMMSCEEKPAEVGLDNNYSFNATDTTWKSMTIREKIGQTMIMLPDREKELELGGGTLEGFFEKYPVSGFFMGWKLFTGIPKEKEIKHILAENFNYSEASKYPLLFQQDYEYGVDLPGMTKMPAEMGLGATNSEKLARDYGKSVALEARSVGVNWMLHPVADLNINRFNPVTNIRSISDDPHKAIQLLSQQIDGIQSEGIAATIKHFPGDGVDYRDQHITTTCNSLPFHEWQQKHGKVFQELINLGVAAIMPGHITLPSYQKEKLNGQYPPATLSKELLTGLLKNEMDFNGVIVSDAMVMGGFRGWYPTQVEGEIQSFLAGVDELLWPSYEFMDTLEVRIVRGEIPMSRLDDAVSRVWALKERFGLLEKNYNPIQEISKEEKQFVKATAKKVSQKALTLLRDRNKQIPIDTSSVKKILVVGVAPVVTKGGDKLLRELIAFSEKLGESGFDVDFKHNVLYETNGWTENITGKYDKIIIALSQQPHYPFGILRLYDNEAQTAWFVNAAPKENLIAVSFGSPYHMDEYFERVNTCINAYSNSPLMHEAVIDALKGNIKMEGISPVKLKN